jgi:hypothetical protein
VASRWDGFLTPTSAPADRQAYRLLVVQILVDFGLRLAFRHHLAEQTEGQLLALDDIMAACNLGAAVGHGMGHRRPEAVAAAAARA